MSESSRDQLSSALSLRPDNTIMDAYVIERNPIAIEIIDGWKFSFPVRLAPDSDPIWTRIGDTTFEQA